MPTIFIDADACPVKEDTFRIAKRYSLKVVVVSNHKKEVPKENWISSVEVEKRFDAVDDWIESNIQAKDIVLTNDILLADRCIKKNAHPIDPRGKIYTENNIGEALATRELMSELRQRGALDLGPKQMGKKHRSNFLSSLDLLINRVLKL